MSNKENLSACKLETLNLSMEPLQMKKKKKGGGYNVRKSLAWNNAFFTDEGVLDSDEISYIIGTPGNCLSTISEEKTNAPYDDLQAVGKNLFKDVPSASSKRETDPVPFSLKHSSPSRVQGAATSASSLKVLPSRGIRRTGTMDSGSQPSLPSSSLKRPAKNNTFQSAMKGSKLPRTPVKKPGQSAIASTNRNAVVSSNKRDVGVGAFKRSTKVVCNKSKAGSEAVSHRISNTVHMPICFPSPSTLGPIPSKTKDNSSPKVTRDNAPSFVVQSSDGPDNSTAKGASLLFTGTAIQRRQMNSLKPSGLRLPSPSLGFFGQQKSSVHQCLKGTDTFRLVQPRVKVPEVPKVVHTDLIKSRDICCVSLNQNDRETANLSIKMKGSRILDVYDPSELRRDELMTKSKNAFTEENEEVEDDGNGIVNNDIPDHKRCRESKLAHVASREGRLCYEVKKNSIKSLLIDDSVLMKPHSEDGVSCAIQCSPTAQFTSKTHVNQYSSVEVGSFSGQLKDSHTLSSGEIANAVSKTPVDCEPKLENSELSGQNINLREIAVEPVIQETEVVADIILTSRKIQIRNMPEPENSDQAKTKENEITDIFSVSQTKDTLMQEVEGKVLVECSVNHMPELAFGQAELVDSGIMVENVPQCSSSILPFGANSSESRTTSGEFKSGGADYVSKDAAHSGSELNGSTTVSSVHLVENFICEDQHKIKNDSNADNATSGFMEVQQSTKINKHLTRKETNPNEESEDKDVLYVNKSDVRLKVRGLSAVPEDTHSEMDPTLCAWDDNTDLIAPIEETTSSSNKNTLKIIPPINAAPFSDEWLAAFEAAGEDILTIKSGAVQNSPTEKVVPEPRPWSPVKRRNNSVGPFDCTKFTSH